MSIINTPTINGGGGTSDAFIRTYWYTAVSSGTSGTITPPTGGSVVSGQWPDGADLLTSEAGTDGKPNWVTPTEADGTPVTASLGEGDTWTLSGIPGEYPLCIVFCYRVSLEYFNDGYYLNEIETERIGSEFTVETFTIDAGIALNKYVTLLHKPSAINVELDVSGAPDQIRGVDFSVDAVTKRVSWDSLGLDGLLSVDDVITISYNY